MWRCASSLPRSVIQARNLLEGALQIAYISISLHYEAVIAFAWLLYHGVILSHCKCRRFKTLMAWAASSWLVAPRHAAIRHMQGYADATDCRQQYHPSASDLDAYFWRLILSITARMASVAHDIGGDNRRAHVGALWQNQRARYFAWHSARSEHRRLNRVSRGL